MVRIHAGLNALRDFNLFFCAEQRKLSDLLQIQALKVVGIGYFSQHLRQFALVIDLLEEDKRLRDDVGRFRRFC